jgi:hypothetical protein
MLSKVELPVVLTLLVAYYVHVHVHKRSIGKHATRVEEQQTCCRRHVFTIRTDSVAISIQLHSILVYCIMWRRAGLNRNKCLCMLCDALCRRPDALCRNQRNLAHGFVAATFF